MAILNQLGAIYSSGGGGVNLTFIDDDDLGYVSTTNDWHPNGNFLAVGHNSGGTDEVSVYSWNGTTLTQVETVDWSVNIRSVQWHPTNNFLAVAAVNAASNITIYSWNGSDTLSSVETVSYGSDAESVSWHPDGDFLAVSGQNSSNEIVIYSWNGTDTLSSVETVNHTYSCYEVEWSHDGNYLAVAHGDGVQVYSWNGTDTLSSVANVSLGTWANWLSWTSDDGYLAVGSSNATKNIIVYSFNGSALSEQTYIGFGSGYRATVDFDSTDTYLFCGVYSSGLAAETSKWIIAYEWDSVTPSLTEVSSESWNGVGIQESLLSPTNAYLASSVNRDANYAKTIRIDSTGLITPPLTVWIAGIGGHGSNIIRGVSYGNGVYTTVSGYGVGLSLVIATTADPVGGSWTPQTLAAATTYPNNTFKYLDGKFVFPCNVSGKGIFYASDPTSTWSYNSGALTTFFGMEYDGTYWATLVYNTCTVYTATSISGTFTARSVAIGGSYAESIKYGNGYWVACGHGGYLGYTSDVTSTWTANTSAQTIFAGDDIMWVDYADGIWVAGGQNGKIITATDPTGTWTQRTTEFGTSRIYKISYGNGNWVACGQSGKICYTSDPTGTWTLVNNSTFGTSHVYAVAYSSDDNLWIAVGGDGKISTSNG